jgi:tRNA(Ile)-lysidine synthase
MPHSWGFFIDKNAVIQSIYYNNLFYVNLDFNYPTGTYIIAVSGGVDSIVLLHALAHQYPNNRYVVAHVDHGIRSDSSEDMAVVRRFAYDNNLQFEYTELNLGNNTSEATARQKRYTYLRNLAKKHEAIAIITAHHQDDVIETMFINLIRGTGRRGLSSLKTTPEIIRPLLGVPKAHIYQYAKQCSLHWREDSTNSDMRYLRNTIRHKVVADMNDENRAKALSIISLAATTNAALDAELTQYVKRGLHKNTPVLNRRWFASQPHDISLEILYRLLTDNGVRDINAPMLERTVVAIKTMRPGKTIQLSGAVIVLTKRSARINMHRKTDENTV